MRKALENYDGLRPSGDSLRRAGERVKGAILFRKREWPLWNPKRKAFDWQFRARMTFVPPEWECLRAALPRLVLLYDLPLLLSSAAALLIL